MTRKKERTTGTPGQTMDASQTRDVAAGAAVGHFTGGGTTLPPFRGKAELPDDPGPPIFGVTPPVSDVGEVRGENNTPG